MPSYNLSILTPEGQAYESEVESIVAPGQAGFFGVLAHHTPMIAAIQLGTLTVKDGDDVSYFVVGEGILEVSSEGVSILADTAERVQTEEKAKTRTQEIAAELADVSST